MTTILERYPQFVRVVPGKSSNPALGDCWEWGFEDEDGVWHGTRTKDGYGKVTIGGDKHLAHRVAYALAFGEMPPKLGLHLCNNHPCCRVEGPGGVNHIKPGTHADNMAQSWAEGRLKRHARGARKISLRR